MKNSHFIKMAMMALSVIAFSACDDDTKSVAEDLLNTTAQKQTNKLFVETTVQPTYEGLAAATAKMIESLESANYVQAGADWKEARRYWEWSEAFLFGAASGYGIDPHIDTWPFDAASFNSYLAKYSPSNNESDAAILEEAIATGQNLTGFHAVEYLLFVDDYEDDWNSFYEELEELPFVTLFAFYPQQGFGKYADGLFIIEEDAIPHIVNLDTVANPTDGSPF